MCWIDSGYRCMNHVKIELQGEKGKCTQSKLGHL